MTSSGTEKAVKEHDISILGQAAFLCEGKQGDSPINILSETFITIFTFSLHVSCWHLFAFLLSFHTTGALETITC